MAQVPPSDVLEGFALLGAGDAAPEEGIFVPLTTLSGLDADEANAETGSIAKVAFEFDKAVEAGYNAIPTANRSSRMTVTRGTPTGASASTVNQTIAKTYTLSIDSSDVASEA